MPNFLIRTTAPDTSNPNYDWTSKLKGQCTWGVYYRTKEIGWPAPTHAYSGGRGWGNAKDWPENAEPDWEVHYVSKEPNYTPIPGDIVSFDGTYGHVIFIEDYADFDKKTYLISQWNKDSDGKYSSDIWHLGDKIKGKKLPTGPVKAYMHYIGNVGIKPVARNTSIDQLEVISDRVYMRTYASTSATKLGFAIPGYYNVYDQADGSGFKWVKVSSSDSVWIAIIHNETYGDSTKLLPASKFDSQLDELVKDNQELSAENNLLNLKIKDLEDTIDEVIDILKKVRNI